MTQGIDDPIRLMTVTLKEHYDALNVIHERYRGELSDERDRRYAEVATEREKALKIKETADLAALGLAREIQTYKDEKANELREQISRERGNYVERKDLQSAIERIDAVLAPITVFVSSQQGRSSGLHAGWGYLVAAAGLALAIASFVSRF